MLIHQGFYITFFAYIKFFACIEFLNNKNDDFTLYIEFCLNCFAQIFNSFYFGRV